MQEPNNSCLEMTCKHATGNLLACFDGGSVGNEREDVRAQGESLMCHGDGATRSKIEVHEGCLKQVKIVHKMCLERGMACKRDALNEASHQRSQ